MTANKNTVTRLSEETKAKLYNLCTQSDLNQYEIANILGISQGSVTKWARRMGILWQPQGNRHHEDSVIRMIVLFRYSVLPTTEILERVGIGSTSARAYLRKMDPEMNLSYRNRVINALQNGETPPVEDGAVKQYQRKLRGCPRELKVRQSRQAIPGKDLRVMAPRNWDEVAAEFNRRVSEDPSLGEPIQAKHAEWIHRKALEKIRPLLEEYEYADDTPNRNFEYLRETV
jgi:hypothetical protein